MEAGQALDQQSRSGLYAKKNRRDLIVRLLAQHPEWQLAFQDEVWWSRLAQPNMSAWTADKPLRLVEKDVDKGDKERKALCCYGVFLPPDEQTDRSPSASGGKMLLRFVDGRPVSQVTCDFLAWLAEKMTLAGKKALVLIWDNASWHVSKIVKSWLKAHNQAAKKDGTCRLVVCFLPSKSPWLNNIEPKWMHGKRAIVEPTRTLTPAELIERICGYYQCEYEAHLTQQLC